MNILRKPLFLAVIALLAVGGTGAALYFSGNLPFLSVGSNDALAAETDTENEDKVSTDEEKPEIMPILLKYYRNLPRNMGRLDNFV